MKEAMVAASLNRLINKSLSSLCLKGKRILEEKSWWNPVEKHEEEEEEEVWREGGRGNPTKVGGQTFFLTPSRANNLCIFDRIPFSIERSCSLRPLPARGEGNLISFANTIQFWSPRRNLKAFVSPRRGQIHYAFSPRLASLLFPFLPSSLLIY